MLLAEKVDLIFCSPWQIAECRRCAPKCYSGMNLHRNAGNNTATYSGHTWYFTETSLTTSIWLLCGLLLAVSTATKKHNAGEFHVAPKGCYAVITAAANYQDLIVNKN